ncbi:hypothetical protein [Methylobacterium indicum]|uniref:hypothetical protein n=1 Tax=Methylobacterium indicum TaxID=1775910 RepID=UPI000AB739E1|nr:hypothetical protein [Methylobacterium indicum]
MNRLSYLIEKERQVGLSKKEYDEVCEIFANTCDKDIKTKCIIIIRKEASPAREQIVSRELSINNPILQSEVLRFLVRDLDLGNKYQDHVIKLLNLEDDQYALYTLQLAALSVSGDAYRSSKNLHILELILKFLEHDRKSLKNAAHDALVSALTSNYRELSPKLRYEKLTNSDIDLYKEKALNIIHGGKN